MVPSTRTSASMKITKDVRKHVAEAKFATNGAVKRGRPEKSKEFGDFQTPQALARQICTLLVKRGAGADVVVEPTCGLGSFLVAAAEALPQAQLLGWDINPEYVQGARAALHQAGAGARFTVQVQDFFKHDWETELSSISGDLLILGNLPWVTNAAVSSLNGSNLPPKQNFQALRGIEARTGKSNFDISEWMLIQLVKALRGRAATLAMLCKTAIARKLLRFAWQNDGQIAAASLHRIDAKKHFGAAVDSCLFLVRTGETGPVEARVFHDLLADTPTATLGLSGQDLVADIATYRSLRHLEGLSPYQWRSGVKHDCASVMEFFPSQGTTLRNKLGETVELEPDYLFPLLKCSDLANGRKTPERSVLVTQTRVGEDTAVIAGKAPRTWTYLNSHREAFAARKSSIYNKRVPFAVFGIGKYAFAPWKVAVSGLHRRPRFACIPPFEGKPIFFDDTCYYLSFQEESEARVVASILNSAPCLEFLTSLVFPDSKRPITVELLQRLNIHAIAVEAGLVNEWSASRNQQVTNSAQSGSVQAEFVMEQPSSP
jgi:hypothetical protein